MTQHIRKARDSRDNIISFVRPMEPDPGASALDLVYQAADVFSDMEVRARETEARAQSMCKAASERVLAAEARSEAANRARRKIITEAECKLQDASRALSQAQIQITAAEDRATAAEVRAQVAEAKARRALETLSLVEEALRNRFCTNSTANSKLSAVA
jgi:hypothetical protein